MKMRLKLLPKKKMMYEISKCKSSARHMIPVVLLLVFVLPLSQLHSQEATRFDATLGPGLCIQLSKILNERFDVGPHVNGMISWRVRDSSRLSLWIGIDYLRSSFGSLTSIEDVEATFVSGGFRIETKSRRDFFNPYFMIGAGVGKTHATLPDPQAYPSIRNTVVMFGVGFTMNVSQRVAFVPMIRLLVSEGSEVSLPIGLCARFDL